MKLTESQEKAVKYPGRNLQLIACAGSGKTEVVAQRIAHLLTKTDDDCLRPRNIVAFTFTNKAAAELRNRIIQRTKEVSSCEITGMAEMFVGTIHGFCQELLQSEVPQYLKYEVMEANRQRIYVDRYSDLTGLTSTTALNGRSLRRWIDTNRYLSALSVLREDDVDEQELGACSLKEGLNKYRMRLSQDSYFDFSALLEVAVEELENNSDLTTKLAERLKYVVVDEYQDVNPIQERLVRLLHDLGAGLCVVGDDDQTIYQWRGSSVENILTFFNRYPSVEQIRLEENFRSSEGVIETARTFIERVGARLPKEMKSVDAQPFERGDLIALSFETPEAEAEYIADTIKGLRGVEFNDDDGKRGLSWSDMAVLLRSVRNNGTVITGALKSAGIPFVVNGLANLFETNEVRAARALFYYLSGEEIDGVLIERSALVDAWVQADLGFKNIRLMEAIDYVADVHDKLSTDSGDHPTIQRVFLTFLDLIRIREEQVPGDQRGQVVMFNLGRFSQVITDWESIHFRSRPIDSFQAFARFLRYQAEDAYNEGAEDNDYLVPDAVQVMTVHQAKGREWPAVFLPALLRNRFPSPSRKSDAWNLIPQEAIKGADRYNGSIEDERRLFYVAMTRSKKFLHMTWAPIQGMNNRYSRKSQFWDDVLASRHVRRRRPDYSNLNRIEAKPRAAVANVEFSFSDLKYMFECPYQFKLRVLYGFNNPLVPPMGYGKSLHDALADVHQRAMRGEIITKEDVPELVNRHLRIPYAPQVLRDRLEELAIRDITNYITDNSDIFPFIEFSEQPVQVDLEDGVSIKGRIDLVRRTDTDETTIVDLKSSERSQEEEVTEIQLHTYALGYQELTGRDADYVEIYELEGRRPIRRAVDEDFIGDVRDKTLEAASALRTMSLEPTPSMATCRQCDFSALCSKSMA